MSTFYPSHCILFIFKSTGNFTQIHSFSIVHSEQNVNINSWITSYPYPHYNFLLVYFVFFIISRCVAVAFSILAFEKDLTNLKQKADKKMSGYVCNKHNATYKALCAVFTHSLPMPLHQKSHSFAALTRSISESTSRSLNTVLALFHEVFYMYNREEKCDVTYHCTLDLFLKETVIFIVERWKETMG